MIRLRHLEWKFMTTRLYIIFKPLHIAPFSAWFWFLSSWCLSSAKQMFILARASSVCLSEPSIVDPWHLADSWFLQFPFSSLGFDGALMRLLSGSFCLPQVFLLSNPAFLSCVLECLWVDYFTVMLSWTWDTCYQMQTVLCPEGISIFHPDRCIHPSSGWGYCCLSAAICSNLELFPDSRVSVWVFITTSA